LSLSFHLTIMVHIHESSTHHRCESTTRPSLALRTMADGTTLVSVETREVCALRTTAASFNTEPTTPLQENATSPSTLRSLRRLSATGAPPSAAPSAEAGLAVAGQVRDIRKARHLSQRTAAPPPHEVPRTYIPKSKMASDPDSGLARRLASALEVDISQLVRDARSVREREVGPSSPTRSAEIAALRPRLEPMHRTLFRGAVRDAAMAAAVPQ